MPLKATFRHGDPKMVDYTPASGNITAGDVVLVGNTAGWTTGIAHRDITNNYLGSLAAGGGVYDVKVASNYAAGTKVWWDAAANSVTTTSTNNAQFGYLVEATTAANTYAEVLHIPYA